MVNVLMSTYNGEKFIKEQIDSILSQTYDNVFITIRDDGSTDSTRNILLDYQKKHNNIKVILGQNLGINGSFYELVKNADYSEYYAFCDQDDFWLPQKISKAVTKLEKKNQDLSLLYCSAYTPANSNLVPISDKINTNIDSFFPSALIKSLAPGCTFVFNNPTRNMFLRANVDKLDIHDWFMHRLVASIGEIIYDNDSYIYYRQHENNAIGFRKDSFLIKCKRMFKCKNIRLNNARILLDIYQNFMDNETKNTLNEFVNYKKGINRIKIIFSRKFQLKGFKNNLLSKFCFLFGVL